MGSLLKGPDINTAGVNKQLAQGQSAAKSLKPVNVSGGGLSSTFNKKTGQLTVTPSALRTGNVAGLAGLYPQQAAEIAKLRGMVAPGYSALRASRLQQIENARRAAIGNLRENLARRRVLGSSFAEDAQTRAELTFGQEADKVAAETFLQELDLTNQLLGQEYEARRGEFTTNLGELNLEAQFAQNMSSQATQTLQASAQLQSQLAASGASTLGQAAISQAELDAKAQAGLGKAIGVAGGYALGGPAGAYAVGQGLG